VHKLSTDENSRSLTCGVVYGHRPAAREYSEPGRAAMVSTGAVCIVDPHGLPRRSSGCAAANRDPSREPGTRQCVSPCRRGYAEAFMAAGAVE